MQQNCKCVRYGSISGCPRASRYELAPSGVASAPPSQFCSGAQIGWKRNCMLLHECFAFISPVPARQVDRTVHLYHPAGHIYWRHRTVPQKMLPFR